MSVVEAQIVLSSILKENPDYWPNGLNLSQFDGGCYLLKSATTSDVVGFAGWQTRKEGKLRVGYYSIGILPEYRNKGLAKEAVAAVIANKSASVDVVRALIKADNTASLALADTLGVDTVKIASSFKPLRRNGVGKFVGGMARGVVDSATGILRHGGDTLTTFDPSSAWKTVGSAADTVMNVTGGIVGKKLLTATGRKALTRFATRPSPLMNGVQGKSGLFGRGMDMLGKATDVFNPMQHMRAGRNFGRAGRRLINSNLAPGAGRTAAQMTFNMAQPTAVSMAGDLRHLDTPSVDELYTRAAKVAPPSNIANQYAGLADNFISSRFAR